MLEEKTKDFLMRELSVWSDFKLTFEQDEADLTVNIKNEFWELDVDIRFSLDDNYYLCVYMSSENYQIVDTFNNNKFFWIELLTKK